MRKLAPGFFISAKADENYTPSHKKEQECREASNYTFRLTPSQVVLPGNKHREKKSLLCGESKHRVWLVTGKAGDCLPHLFCGKPAPFAENEMLRRVSACEAICAALRNG